MEYEILNPTREFEEERRWKKYTNLRKVLSRFTEEDVEEMPAEIKKAYFTCKEEYDDLEADIACAAMFKRMFGPPERNTLFDEEEKVTPAETVSTEMYEVDRSAEVVQAQMKPKQKTKRKQVVRRTTIPQTLTAGLGGFRANKITSTVKAMSLQEVKCKASGKPGESRITPIAFTLRELYPMPENDDKFAEFKLSRVEISLIGFSGVAPDEYPGTTVLIAPNPDERMAANISELLRHYGVRVCPILACQNSVVRLISVMPRFDETGSNNHYVSGFLQVGEAQDIEWYGATIAIQGPTSSKDVEWTVKLLLTTTIIFRGRQ